MSTTTKTTNEIRTEVHMGSLFTWLADGESTGGSLAMAETEVRAGGEPPLHIHAREDEVFYVLEGDVVFQRGLALIEARAGDAVVLPRGIQHGFALRSETARMLVVTTPAGLEKAFREFSQPASADDEPSIPDGPPKPQAMAAYEAAFSARGVTFVGPPLAALLSEGGDALLAE
ncbi:MAG TPA: cupin domain-containing protein [Solirubrobacterales bacterium]|nr:cupin domain-containing protein [Solirubrobacterales bacterium]